MRRILFELLSVIFLEFGLHHLSFGQYYETVNTDRPGQAFTPFTVGKGAFQVESGLVYIGSKDSNRNIRNNSLGLTGFFKHGLSETFELNYGITVLNQAIRTDTDDKTDAGVQGINLGGRFNIKSGEGNKPSYGFLFTLLFNNFAHPAFRSEHVAPLFLFLYKQSVSDRVSLTGNLGMSWNGDTPDPQANYVVNLGFTLSDDLSVFVENYGWIRNEDFDSHFDGGISYLVSNNLQLDISGGYGKNNGISDFFAATGISIRSAR